MEIIRDPRSLAFCNFFVKESMFDSVALKDALGEAGDDAYVETTETGIYVSMAPEFNPQGRGLDSLEAQYRSARIGLILANGYIG